MPTFKCIFTKADKRKKCITATDFSTAERINWNQYETAKYSIIRIAVLLLDFKRVEFSNHFVKPVEKTHWNVVQYFFNKVLFLDFWLEP